MTRLLSTLFVILSLTFTICLAQNAKYVKELENLTDKQIYVFAKSLWHGRDHDMSILLAAIAWKESNFGKYKVNDKDGKHGSYGSHQILMDTVLNSLDINPDEETIEVIKNRLIDQEELSIHFAIEELKYWYKRHKGNLDKTIASYNAGNKGIKSKAGKNYAKDIKLRMKLIKTYVENRGLVFTSL